MQYTLYIASAADDKHSVYSWILADFSDCILDHDVYIAGGERRFDASYCGHIALQRALRRAAKQPGVITLHIAMEAEFVSGVGWELMDMNPPLYPSLCATTKRILRRFNKFEFSVFYPDDAGKHVEVSAVDNADESLEDARTIAGRIRLRWNAFVRPKQLIQ